MNGRLEVAGEEGRLKGGCEGVKSEDHGRGALPGYFNVPWVVWACSEGGGGGLSFESMNRCPLMHKR